MKTLATFAIAASLLFAHTSVQAADPVSELASFATEQLAIQAAELKKDISEQIRQSLTESLAEAVADDVESTQNAVVASLKTEQDKVREL